MAAFIDDAAVEDRPVRQRRGGRRAGARRRRLNPNRLPELDKQSKYWHFTVFYTEDDDAVRALITAKRY